jgi:hypothetical protein
MKATYVLLLAVLTAGFTAASAPLLPHAASAEPAWMMLSGAALLGAAGMLKKVRG